jgi:hypothetical protein
VAKWRPTRRRTCQTVTSTGVGHAHRPWSAQNAAPGAAISTTQAYSFNPNDLIWAGVK